MVSCSTQRTSILPISTHCHFRFRYIDKAGTLDPGSFSTSKAKHIMAQIENAELTGTITGNVFTAKSGETYPIAWVEGYDSKGAEHVYHSWKFPDSYPANATLLDNGKVGIL